MFNIIVIDVETPNRKNDKICSIGIAVIKNDKIHSKNYYLVNPEVRFDSRNIKIHGISEFDVENEPAFTEIWKEIKNLFKNNIIAGHGIAFDLSVLAKTLYFYGISLPKIAYIDTLAISRKQDDCSKHALDAACKHNNIELQDHHNALCDAESCANLLLNYMKNGTNLCEFIDTYYLQNYALDVYDESTVEESNSCTSLNNEIDPVLAPFLTDRFDIGCKNIVLTGDFRICSKENLVKILSAQGIKCVKTVTQQTDLVVVGSLGSNQWKFGNFGNKIQKAIDMKQNGSNIQIVIESNFIESLKIKIREL